MADGYTETSSDEKEARHQAFKNTRIREFYKQGFEAGLEVASEEVIGLDSVELLTVILKVSLPVSQRTQALALYKEGYEVGQTIFRRKVGYIFLSRGANTVLIKVAEHEAAGTVCGSIPFRLLQVLSLYLFLVVIG